MDDLDIFMIFRLLAKLALVLFGNFTIFAHNLANFDVEVIAPSSGVSQELAKKISEIIGKKIESGKNSEAQVFADAKIKFQKLDASLRTQHKILWALRGGYGVDKIMPLIIKKDYSKEMKKIIIGYSDLTALMIYFSQKYGWLAVNAPMLKDFATKDKSSKSYTDIVNFLKNKNGTLKISDLQPINEPSRLNKIVKGKVTGGNLTCIISTIGTPWQIKTAGKIIFLEDTNVSGFRLDRLLTHMKNAGLFDNAVAIIFGDFGANTDTIKILKTFANNLHIPVYKSASFGHQKVNLPFVYGFNGTISSHQNNAEIVMSK